MRILSSSWPGLSRPSTSLPRDRFEKIVPIGNVNPSTCHVEILQDVDGWDKPGHDEKS
jgi:hypothetical protein